MISLRQLTPDDDLDHLIAISREFFDEYSVHHQAFFQIDELTPQHIRDFFSRSVATDNGATFIATAQGGIVGYITVFVRTQEDFWKIKRVGSISGLMVSRDYRRRGIATGLLGKAVAYLRRRGIKVFTTYTAVANEEAVRFFERSGMMPLHTTFIGEI